jgi:GTPase Era involved in 16S rRNA processing
VEYIDFVNRALNTLEKQSDRYRHDIDNLKKKMEKWSLGKIRIGVIGVTSSGKSTLINAILGKELLSHPLKPSSSQLVSCFKDEQAKAVITFEHKSTEILTGKQLTLEKIRKYRDENENAGNRERIRDIQIGTPSFDFGKEVVLIDSAGLDAYKLESHEKLSLEILLPTIDICIFVTTLKANSEEKARVVLNSIAKHKCPVIIIQNMLDSVESSADGKKTKEMVARDHQKRVQRIVDESQIEDKKAIPIVQMSARYAVEERCGGQKDQDSQYDKFKETIDAMIIDFIPKINGERFKSAFERCSQLVAEEENKMSGVRKTKKPHFKFEGIKISLNEKLKKTKGNLKRQFAALTPSVSQSKNVDAQLKKAKSIVKECAANILQIISDFNDYISGIVKKLSIPLRDVITNVRFASISEPKKIEKEVVIQVEKPGVGGKIERFFGKIGDILGIENNLGYKNDTKKELDESRTIEELGKYMQRAQAVYGNTIEGWLKDIGRTIKNINVEIDNEYASFQQRQEKVTEANVIVSIIADLKQLLSEAEENINKNTRNKKQAPVQKPGKTLNNHRQAACSGYALGIRHLARKKLRIIANQSLKYALKVCHAPEYSLVVGWDSSCLQDFINRFFGYSLEENEAASLEKSESFADDNFTFRLNPDNKFFKKARTHGAYTLYVMVNAQQDGAARKQIAELRLENVLEPRDKVFFVVQDFGSIINSGKVAIQEMRDNLLEYFDIFNIAANRGLVLINDDNPLYNMAFIESQLNPCHVISDETDLLNSIKNSFSFLTDSGVSDKLGYLIRTKQ